MPIAYVSPLCSSWASAGLLVDVPQKNVLARFDTDAKYLGAEQVEQDPLGVVEHLRSGRQCQRLDERRPLRIWTVPASERTNALRPRSART